MSVSSPSDTIFTSMVCSESDGNGGEGERDDDDANAMPRTTAIADRLCYGGGHENRWCEREGASERAWKRVITELTHGRGRGSKYVN